MKQSLEGIRLCGFDENHVVRFSISVQNNRKILDSCQKLVQN